MILIAKIISFLFGPFVLVPILSYLMVAKSTGDLREALVWTVTSSIFSLTVLVFVYFGIRRNFFSNFDISKREERLPLFIFTAIIGFLYFVLVFLLNGPKIMLFSLGGLFVGILLAGFINRKMKVSLHLAIFSSFSMILGILYGKVFLLSLLFVPLVAWSRIKLRKHFLSETIVGTILGSFLVLGLYYVVKYFL